MTTGSHISHISQKPGQAQNQAEIRANVAIRLRQLREERGVSIRHLAKLSELSRNTVISALRGSVVNPRTIDRLFQALDSAPGFDQAIFSPRLTLEDMEIAMGYHDASTALRNFIARLLKTREYKDSPLKPETLALAHEIEELDERDREMIKRMVQWSRDIQQQQKAGPPQEPHHDEHVNTVRQRRHR